MVTTIKSASIRGVESVLVDVEVDVSSGLPCMEMIGLLGTEVREAKERVRVALKNNGFSIPPIRITVNLSPADIRKDGTQYDLPIALALLTGLGNIPAHALDDTMVAGELGLNGEIKMIHGVLPMVLEAKDKGYKKCILPKENGAEGAVIEGIKIIGADNLCEIVNYLNTPCEKQDEIIKPTLIDVKEIFEKEKYAYNIDFGEISGQESVKRAMLIAAAGFHNVLMIGAPGSGKTMAAKRIPTILPPLTMEESMDVSKIYSVSGLLNEQNNLISRRPFVSPHHTVSDVAMAGGGRIPHPGIISRAHKGVLFLDEAVHFNSSTLEILRQPMEDKEIHVARTGGNFTFPADFMLVIAINPCPCGNYPDEKTCTCSNEQIKKYLSKLSGPILDRIDICVEAPRLTIDELHGKRNGMNSIEMRNRALAALEIQKQRFKGTNIIFNSQMGPSDIEKYVVLGDKEDKLMRDIYSKMNLSVRGYHRILRVARTIADLDEKELIETKHLMEAVCYRSLEEKYWNK